MLDALKRDPWPRSHWDLIEHYYAEHDRQIASGEIKPFLYPWGALGAFVVIAYLLIPHQNRPWLKNCRFLAFAWLVGFAIYSTLYTRAKGMAPSFGVGLINAWSVVWISAILICNDAQTDFQRIERLEGAFRSSKLHDEKDKNESNGQTNSKEDTTEDMTTGHAGPSNRHGAFAWQPYPLTPFIERLDWVCDIFSNFRGAGWNWRTSALPPPPKAIQAQLQRNSAKLPKTSTRTHPSQFHLYPTRSALLSANLKSFVIGYIVLDFLKTTIMHDPYFWGLLSRPPPSYFPFSSSPVGTHITRLALSQFAIMYALGTLFSLGPLFFSGVLGPQLLGARAEPWMFPETWAPYTVVLDNGLAGWWGNWWHQTFRFAFQEPSRKVLEVLGVQKKSIGAKAAQLMIAFALSGLVHASGSLTCAGPTRPIRGPFVFFLLQGLGIFVEGAVAQALKPLGMQQRLPRWAMRTWTFTYVHVWFYFTAHLLCDDFAAGGIWLFEPIPISIFRGLGFGADRRDGWWCWGGVFNVLRWHRGDSWWTTGIAL